MLFRTLILVLNVVIPLKHTLSFRPTTYYQMDVVIAYDGGLYWCLTK
jgi:hypothetical protein